MKGGASGLTDQGVKFASNKLIYQPFGIQALQLAVRWLQSVSKIAANSKAFAG